jgi:glycogen operon protein
VRQWGELQPVLEISDGRRAVFFLSADDTLPSRVVTLVPSYSRTCHYWHAFVPGVAAGQIYTYRV